MKNILIMTMFVLLIGSLFAINTRFSLSQACIGSPCLLDNWSPVFLNATMGGANSSAFQIDLYGSGTLGSDEVIGGLEINLYGNSSDADDSGIGGVIVRNNNENMSSNVGAFATFGQQMIMMAAIDMDLLITPVNLYNTSDGFDTVITAGGGYEDSSNVTTISSYFESFNGLPPANFSFDFNGSTPVVTSVDSGLFIAVNQTCTPQNESWVDLDLENTSFIFSNSFNFSVELWLESETPANNLSTVQISIEDEDAGVEIQCGLGNASSTALTGLALLIFNHSVGGGFPEIISVTNLSSTLYFSYDKGSDEITCSYANGTGTVPANFSDASNVTFSISQSVVGFPPGATDLGCGNYTTFYRDLNITYDFTGPAATYNTDGGNTYIIAGQGRGTGDDGDIIFGYTKEYEPVTYNSRDGNIGFKALNPLLDIVLNGSLSHGIKTITSEYSVAAHDYILLVNSSAGGFNIHIDTEDDIAGRVLIVNIIDNSHGSNEVRIDGSGNVNIGSAGFINITTELATVYLIFDGLGNAHIMDPFLHSPQVEGTMNINGGLDATQSITTGGGFSSTSGLNINSGDSYVIDLYAEDIEADAIETDELEVIGDSVFNETEAESMDTDELTVEGISYLYGNVVLNVTGVTANHTTTQGNNILWVNTTNQVNITMDSFSVQVDGVIYTIKDGTGNSATKNIIVDTDGAETIDGASTLTINGDWDSIDLFSYDGNWYIR